MLNYTLRHKNISVIDIEIDESGYIAKLGKVYDSRHMPIGVTDRKSLNAWWLGRSIPAGRYGIDAALQSIDVLSPTWLIEKCFGLSLSDQYWAAPKGAGLRWETVNFFENDFSQDMGEILFGHEPADLESVSLMSPDNTSDGWLRKRWIISEGKRLMMKGGSGVYQQEPFNEVIACTIMGWLGINHVDYELAFSEGSPYSLCECFVTANTELVMARRVMEFMKKDNSHSELTHLLRCCEHLGIPGVQEGLNKMLVLDYVIANEDRHYNNFGFIRNADTLEWLGFAPIYDSGTSLWYNTLRVGAEVNCKPFRKNHNQQIKLVTDLSWFNLNAPGGMNGLEEEILRILAPSDSVDEVRGRAIAKAVIERAGRVTD